MAITGIRNTANFGADERPKNWREGLFRMEPNGMMPLLGLTSALKERQVDDPEFYWWEKDTPNQRVTIGTAIANTTDTTIALSSGALGLKAGDVLLIENTGEQVRITADPTTDTSITVARGHAGTTKAALNIATSGVNPNMLVIGHAYEENSEAPTGTQYDGSKRYNLCGIFRQTYDFSKTAVNTKLRTTEQVKEAKLDCANLIGMTVERAMLLGRRWEGTLNGNPVRNMNGIEAQIDGANVKTVTTDYASGLTMEGLEEYLFQAFRYGANEKMAICGNKALLTIQQVIRKNSQYQIQNGLKEYGMNVTRLTCPFGELVFKTHPLLNQVPGGTNTTAYYGMDSWCYILDMACIEYTYLRNRDIKHEENLQLPGQDGLKNGFIGEVSVALRNPKKHFLLKNLVKAAKDA